MSSPGEQKLSEMGILSCLVGGTMLVVQALVLAAAAVGIKDNQGYIYVFSIPFFTYLVGVPLGLGLAVAGLAQSGRERGPARLGLALTLAGPLLFVAVMVVMLVFRSG